MVSVALAQSWLDVEAGNKIPIIGTDDGAAGLLSYKNDGLSLSEIPEALNVGKAGRIKPTAIVAPSGQIGWWPGDGNASDISGTNNGALAGGAGFGIGKVGQAFDLDGVTGSIQVPHDPNQNINGSFSAETWIFPRSVNNNSPRILEKSDGSNRWLLFVNQSSPSNAFGLVINPNQVTFLSAPNSIVLNEWSHVAFAYDSVNNEVKLFLNGAQVATTTTTAITTTSTNPLVIGNDFSTGTRPFDGIIDEPAIYNETLSAAQVQAIFDAGITGKLKQNATIETSSSVSIWQGEGNANDTRGVNNGTFTANVYATGKVGQAFVLDGNDDHVNMGLVQSTQVFSLDAWVRPLSPVSDSIDQELILVDGVASIVVRKIGGIDRPVFQYRDSTGSAFEQVIGTTAIPLNTFTHLTGTQQKIRLPVLF